MAADVVNRNQRLSACQRHSLGIVDPDQQSADQSRGIGDSDGIDALKGLSGIIQRLLYHSADIFGMAAGGNLRHYAAVQFMFLDL